MTLEIISRDRVLLHTGPLDPAGLAPEDALVEAFLDFAEEKSIPRPELDGMVAVAWPDSNPDQTIEVYGSEWRS